VSSLQVTPERLVIHQHPNADALELAQVGEYKAVVRKGEFKTGDYALYIPEQAVLPQPLIEELGLTGKLAGKDENRVKAVRFRGELSQGIVCRPQSIMSGMKVDLRASENDQWNQVLANNLGWNIADFLGVTKWVPEIPSHLSGSVYAAPDLIRWIDIENIKRYPNIFQPGELVIASEKIHGSCCCVSYNINNGAVHVSSKGFAAKSLAIEESESNLYWRAVHKYGLKNFAACAANVYGYSVVVFGEVYGAGIQDLHYGTERKDDPGFAVFDIAYIDHNGQRQWLDQALLSDLCSNKEIPIVPTIYNGPYDYAKLAALAEGPSVIANGTNIREGLVVRPERERYSDVLGGRTIGKLVGEGYLTRSNGTEYE
jgi:RNA ligase (TIGR02306 family)